MGVPVVSNQTFLFFVIILLGAISFHGIQGYYLPPGPAEEKAFTASVATDKDTYVAGEVIVISGEVNQYDENRVLQISIMDPLKKLVLFEKIPVEDDGTFSYSFTDTEDFEEDGRYTVRAQYGTSDVEIGTSIFSFVATSVSTAEINTQAASNSKTNISGWIKQVAEFWVSDQIDDSGFVQVIEYLVQHGIISIPYAEAPEGEAAVGIPIWIKSTTEFWANGDVSDDEFATALEWLINNGIIRV